MKREHFPDVPDDKIIRWHPKFPVDSVPNIPVACLPAEPETKVCTAKDVLNKIKGSVQSRVSIFSIQYIHICFYIHVYSSDLL